MFGCAESSLLYRLFSSCGELGPLSSCSAQASHCGSFSCCRAWALGCTGFSSCGFWVLEHRLNSVARGLVAPQHVASSWIRDRTRVSCIGRWIPYHWATREGSWKEEFTLDYLCAKSLQSCLTLCNSMDYSLPVSSIHGILQARILEWVAMPSSRESSQPRDKTCVSFISSIGRWVPYH